MKKRLIPAVLVLIIVLFSSCSDGVSIEVKTDSLGRKLDTAADRIWDTTKTKFKEVKDRIKVKVERDSADK